MAYLGETFTASELPEDDGFSPIPAGIYPATIEKADLTDTKDGTGKYIKLQLSITGDKYANRKVFANLNIRNKSDAAEKIGRQQLGSILKAVGIVNLQDSDELIGHNLQIKVSIRHDEQYGTSNEVKGYSALPGGSSAMPFEKPQQQSQPAAKSSTPPWAKK